MELWAVSLVLLGVLAAGLVCGVWIAVTLLAVGLVAMFAFTNSPPGPARWVC